MADVNSRGATDGKACAKDGADGKARTKDDSMKGSGTALRAGIKALRPTFDRQK